MKEKIYDLVIIGGGPAGITAAIYAKRQKLDLLIITKEIGGQVNRKAVKIENFPGILEISGKELIENFFNHLKKYEIKMEIDEVTEVKKKEDFFFVKTKQNKEFLAKAIIVASGASPRPLSIPGEKEFLGKGVSYCVTCLPPGEEVVANDSLKKIEEIGISQKVLTGNGDFQNINQIMSRDYNGEIIKIKTRFFTEPVRLTSNHPVLTAEIKRIPHRRTQIVNEIKWKKAGELTLKDVLLYPIISKIKDVEKIHFSKILGVEAKNKKAKNDQETHTSLRLPDEIPINGEFLRLAGYYLSEGSLGMHEIRFYFNKNEKEYIEDAKKIIKTLFGLTPQLKSKGNVTYVSICSKLIRNLFYLLFGKNAPNKKIPHWMLFLPKEKQKEFIKGIYRGDGCRKEKCFEIVTVSRTLAYQLRDILLRFRIIPSISKREREKLNKLPGEIGGRKIRFNCDRYHIRIGGPSLEKMSEILGIRHPKIDERKRICRHAWIKGRYLYLPIREIKKESYKGKVYNLMVEGNSTYVAKNFIVHNCDGPLFKNKVVAVIGGGNAGFEAAIFLANYAKKIYILEFSEKVIAEKENQERAQKTGKIEVITNAQVKEIKGEKFVKSLVYQDRASQNLKEIFVDGVFIEIGSIPATSFVKDLVDFNQRNEIIVEFETMATKTPGLFAAGDCNFGKFKQIITACGEGAKAALAAYDYLQQKKSKD